jgi:ferredoxin
MPTIVWIDETCIACGACADVAPDLFATDSSGAVIVRGEARVDGRDGPNLAERSPLRDEVAARNQQQLQDAIQGCPTEAVKTAFSAP